VKRTDIDLLTAWRQGDKRSGNELVRRHFTTLYRFYRNKVDDNIADLMQRTFLACVEARDRVPEDVSFRAYLLGIARNKLLHHFRKRHREDRALRREELTPADAPGSPSRVMAIQQEQRLLLRAMRALPLDLQIAVELFYWEELKIAEIASVLEVPEGTVKSRLARAKTLLRTLIVDAAITEDLRRSTVDNLEVWARSLRAVTEAEAEARRGEDGAEESD
jgi:RNA polymerase sigma-70 factor (ECF subfamily)